MRWASDSGSGSAVVSYTRAYLIRKEPLTMAQMNAHESPHATLLIRNAAHTGEPQYQRQHRRKKPVVNTLEGILKLETYNRFVAE